MFDMGNFVPTNFQDIYIGVYFVIDFNSSENMSVNVSCSQFLVMFSDIKSYVAELF